MYKGVNGMIKIARPGYGFVQIPNTVLDFLTEVRPPSITRVYLVMYRDSIAFGKKTTGHLSFRGMAEVTKLRKSTVEKNVRALVDWGFLAPIESNNYGTRYVVRLPKRDRESRKWFPVDLKNAKYMTEREVPLATVKSLDRFSEYSRQIIKMQASQTGLFEGEDGESDTENS